MKKVLALMLAVSICGSMLTACGSKTPTEEGGQEGGKSVTLNVVTSYGGDDGNRKNYETAYKAYESATGNKVLDASETSNEEWKAKIMTDFETGSEPDVLFYFNGVDANKLVSNNKFVSIDEIRAEYPDFASNMKDDMITPSPADGKKYAIPVNGYWEGLYVNKKVLADCGVEMPTANTTWDEFMTMCETIAAKGYTPIAASLNEVPHYWFEFAVLNNGTPANHTVVPQTADDAAGKVWANGLNDIKEMYEKGFFPKNTLTATDAETFQLMAEDKAAFAIDGSWKMGWFKDNAMDLNDFAITYVPGKGERKSTDVIGGLSMGYYITRKAWDDPEKREAAVEFVKAMTTDDVVSTFGATAVTALKNGTKAPADKTAFDDEAIAMGKGATSVIPATQDGLTPDKRAQLFSDVKNVVAGKMTAEEAVAAALAVK